MRVIPQGGPPIRGGPRQVPRLPPLRHTTDYRPTIANLKMHTAWRNRPYFHCFSSLVNRQPSLHIALSTWTSLQTTSPILPLCLILNSSRNIDLCPLCPLAILRGGLGEPSSHQIFAWPPSVFLISRSSSFGRYIK